MSLSRTLQSISIQTKELPYAPPQVDLDRDLCSTGKLLSDINSHLLRLQLWNKPEQRYRKTSVGQSYGIIKLNGLGACPTLYTVYKGVKQDKALGSGGYGKVKLVQSEVGVWYALKVQQGYSPIVKHEHAILIALDQAVGSIFEKEKNPYLPFAILEITFNQKFLLRDITHTPTFKPMQCFDNFSSCFQAITSEPKKYYLELTTQHGLWKLYQQDDKGRWKRDESGHLIDINISCYQEALKKAFMEPDGLLRIQNWLTQVVDKRTHVIMKLAPGIDLLNLINEKQIEKTLPALRLIDIALQALRAVKNVHNHHILHCDIKTENFVYHELTNKLTLIDYGLSLRMDQSSASAKAEVRGTRDCMAPEINLRSEKRFDVIYNEKTEIYALGHFFKDYLELPALVLDDNRVTAAFVQRMKAHEPERRPTLDEAITFFQALYTHLAPAFLQVGLLSIERLNIIAILQDKKQFLGFTQALSRLDYIYFVSQADYASELQLLKLQRDYERFFVQAGTILKTSLLITPDIGVLLSLVPKGEETGIEGLYSIKVEPNEIDTWYDRRKQKDNLVSPAKPIGFFGLKKSTSSNSLATVKHQFDFNR